MCLIWLPVFSYFFFNEPELGVGINPGMALTPLPSSIGRRSNKRPSDHEPSATSGSMFPFLTKTFCPNINTVD